MSKVFKFILGLCLVAIFGFGGVWGTQQLMSQEDGGSGPTGPRTTRVGLASPVERRVEEDVTGVGTLRAIRAVELTTVAAGRVADVQVSSGQTVSQGDVLIRLDDRVERAALTDAEATLTESESDLRRFEELAQSNTAADARLEEARANFLRAEAAVMSARAALDDRTITAPFDGTIGLFDVEPGSYLTTQTPISTLFDLSAVELELSLPERYFDRVIAGQTVTMTTPAYPDETFEGEVSVRATQIDLASRSFDIRARVANPEGRLVGGMFANARLVLDTYDALAIPDDAIISEGLSTFVYTVADGKAARTEIELGNAAGALTEVREGLDMDDRVVVAGWDNLTDGAAVEIDEDFSAEALN